MSEKKETQPATTGGEAEQKDWRRGRNRRGKRQGYQTAFKGRCEELSKYVYDCVDAKMSADMYRTTMREIVEYVGRTYKHAGDIRLTLEALARPNVQIPPEPTAPASRGQILLWEKKLDELAKRDMTLDDNIRKAYSLIYGQCSDAIRQKLEACEGQATAAANLDAIALLKNIRSVMYNFEQSKYTSHTLHEAIQRFYRYYQDPTMSCDEYSQGFNNMVEVIEHCGGKVGIFEEDVIEALAPVTIEDATRAQLKTAQDKAQEKYLACALILGADRTRYGRLVEDLQNNHTQGTDRYPKTRDEALNLLVHWKYNPRNHLQRGGTSGGVAFANVGSDGDGEGRRRTPIEEITCFICKKKGHYSYQCPLKQDENGTGTTLMMNSEEGPDEGHYMGFQFWQSGKTERVPKAWILLDSQSTVNVFCNPCLLQDIRTVNRTMTIRCNAGSTTVNKMGTLPGFGDVWYDPKGIANILSLALVQQTYHVTYDSKDGNAFIVWKPDGSCRRFTQDASGLYYFDSDEQTGVTLVNTVEDNIVKHTPRAYERAKHMRKIQHIIGHPSVRTLRHVITNNMIKNCPLSVRDVTLAEKIYGPRGWRI